MNQIAFIFDGRKEGKDRKKIERRRRRSLKEML